MQSLISQESEFLADASSAQYCRNPDALARALQKIQGASGVVDSAHYKSYAFMGLTGIDSWFSTHPPIESRIKTLVNENREPIFARALLHGETYEAHEVSFTKNSVSKTNSLNVNDAMVAASVLSNTEPEWSLEDFNTIEHAHAFLYVYSKQNNLTKLFSENKYSISLEKQWSKLNNQQIISLIFKSFSYLENYSNELLKIHNWIQLNLNAKAVFFIVFAYVSYFKPKNDSTEFSKIMEWIQTVKNNKNIDFNINEYLSIIFNLSKLSNDELKPYLLKLKEYDVLLEQTLKFVLNKIKKSTAAQ